MEVIFNQSGVGGNSGMSADDETEYGARVQQMISDSISYEEEYLAPAREENQRYYQGLEPRLSSEYADPHDPHPEEDKSVNKSSFVSTDVRDTILAILPSLIRIFTSSEKIAWFVPTSEEQQPIADMQYDYANYVFYEDNPGFLTLHSVFKDALTVKTGIVTWYTDTDHEVTEKTFQNITVDQYQLLLSEVPDAEVVELEGGEEGIIDLVTFRYTVSKPLIRVTAVPPDEFRIARDAKDPDSAVLIGWERTVHMTELTKRGYDPEILKDMLSNAEAYSDERFLRNPGMADNYSIQDGVQFGEWYIRIDGDGDGIDELRYITTIGNGRIIVEDYVVPKPKFAVFQVDPRPHTAVGDCIADITKDIQRMKSNMMRGQLDNLAETINPRTVVNELVTNIEDVMNDEVGAIIRTRGDPSTAVAFTKTPYTGEQVQSSIDYLDKVRASRTGITEASKGLDPKAMQSTALSGIDAIVSGAQERIELIARVLAETGLRPMLKGIVQEIMDNPNHVRTIQLRGEFVQINPSLFDASLKVKVNPTLGKGTDIVRLQALADVKETQLMIITKYGLKNPIVTPIQFLNTVQDMLEIANIKDMGRYFVMPSPEVIKGIMEAPEEPDPALLLAQAELEKTKKDIVIATGEQQIKQDRLALDDAKAKEDADFKRDKLNIDTMLELAATFNETISQQQALAENNPSQ